MIPIVSTKPWYRVVIPHEDLREGKPLDQDLTCLPDLSGLNLPDLDQVERALVDEALPPFLKEVGAQPVKRDIGAIGTNVRAPLRVKWFVIYSRMKGVRAL